jgi:peptidoglycan glycosyltransferase
LAHVRRARHDRRVIRLSAVSFLAALAVTTTSFVAEARKPAPRARALQVDANLQRAAQRLLLRSRAPEGAIVISDVRTGRILAWSSRGPIDYVKAPIAPSASLFKVATATALLESGKVGLDTRECYAGGERRIEEADLGSLAGQGARCIPFVQALGHSVNLVFARLAVKHLTAESLRDAANALGLSSAIPSDFGAPVSELLVPESRLGLARAAAGFWNGRLSPLGALFMMQTIANRGERIKLHLFDDGAPVVRESLGRAMRESTADMLRRMLEVTTREGTSRKAWRLPDGTRALPNVRVAGKTGTLIGGKPARMYSWFAGFAPADKPEIAIAVMLADDVSWWKKANLVAREALEAYFARSER